MSRNAKVGLVALVAVLIGIVLLGCAATAVGAALPGLGAGLGRKVAIVRVEGPISLASGNTWLLSTSATDRRVIADLHKAEADPSVAAILLYVNSPGGSVVASDEIYRAVKGCKKPVVAYFAEVAASGGYYISCGAKRIVAHPDTMTGSIGVISEIVMAKGLLDKLGVTVETVKSGPAKDMGSPARPLTPEEREILQGLIDEAYQNFVDVVAAGRNLPREQVLRLADGRVYSGRQALELGLVDQLGSMDDAVMAAGGLAGLKGVPQTKEMRSQASLMEVLLGAITKPDPVSALQQRLYPSLEYRLAP